MTIKEYRFESSTLDEIVCLYCKEAIEDEQAHTFRFKVEETPEGARLLLRTIHKDPCEWQEQNDLDWDMCTRIRLSQVQQPVELQRLEVEHGKVDRERFHQRLVDRFVAKRSFSTPEDKIGSSSS